MQAPQGPDLNKLLVATTNARKAADEACNMLGAFMYSQAHPPSPIMLLNPQANGVAGRIHAGSVKPVDPSLMHQQQLQALLQQVQMQVSNLIAMSEEIKVIVTGGQGDEQPAEGSQA